MSEERSLTEFSSTEPATGEAEGKTSGGSDGVDTKMDNQSTETEPATITYRWQPEGVVCTQCGTSTQKQWCSNGQFVCPDCKTWDKA